MAAARAEPGPGCRHCEPRSDAGRSGVGQWARASGRSPSLCMSRRVTPSLSHGARVTVSHHDAIYGGFIRRIVRPRASALAGGPPRPAAGPKPEATGGQTAPAAVARPPAAGRPRRRSQFARVVTAVARAQSAGPAGSSSIPSFPSPDRLCPTALSQALYTCI